MLRIHVTLSKKRHCWFYENNHCHISELVNASDAHNVCVVQVEVEFYAPLSCAYGT